MHPSVKKHFIAIIEFSLGAHMKKTMFIIFTSLFLNIEVLAYCNGSKECSTKEGMSTGTDSWKCDCLVAKEELLKEINNSLPLSVGGACFRDKQCIQFRFSIWCDSLPINSLHEKRYSDLFDSSKVTLLLDKFIDKCTSPRSRSRKFKIICSPTKVACIENRCQFKK